MSRNRGAQRNNKNAWKHGFYSKQFKASERRALSEMSATDLKDEIDAMRVQFRRFLEFDNLQAEDLDYKTHLSKLRATSIFMGRLASLIRTQKGGAKSELEQEIREAIIEVGEEMGIE